MPHSAVALRIKTTRHHAIAFRSLPCDTSQCHCFLICTTLHSAIAFHCFSLLNHAVTVLSGTKPHRTHCLAGSPSLHLTELHFAYAIHVPTMPKHHTTLPNIAYAPLDNTQPCHCCAILRCARPRHLRARLHCTLPMPLITSRDHASPLPHQSVPRRATPMLKRTAQCHVMPLLCRLLPYVALPPLRFV